MCVRRRVFLAPCEACSEIPVLAASEIIATNFFPCMNAFFSEMLTPITSFSPLKLVPLRDAVEPRDS